MYFIEKFWFYNKKLYNDSYLHNNLSHERFSYALFGRRNRNVKGKGKEGEAKPLYAYQNQSPKVGVNWWRERAVMKKKVLFFYFFSLFPHLNPFG